MDPAFPFNQQNGYFNEHHIMQFLLPALTLTSSVIQSKVVNNDSQPINSSRSDTGPPSFYFYEALVSRHMDGTMNYRKLTAKSLSAYAKEVTLRR